MSKEVYEDLSEQLIHYDNWDVVDGLYELLPMPYTHDYTFLTDKEHWQLIIDCWSMAELNSQKGYVEKWEEILKRREPINHFKKHLPDQLTIYRGGYDWGLSWTTSKKKAEWFIRRKKLEHPLYNPKPKKTKEPLSVLRVKKKDIMFYDNARKEKEVVIVPPTLGKKLGYKTI
jgi:hypothetical protein